MIRRIVLLLCGLGATGGCASITVAGQSASPGQALMVSVTFSSGGQAIPGIQFDLSAAAGLAFGVLPGAQIGASGKALYTASLPNNGLRVLIAGLNGTAIADGEVLRMPVSVDAGATTGAAAIRIGNLFATDPMGNAMELDGNAGLVQIQQPTTPAPPFVSGGVLSAASLLPGPVSPGEALTIVGAPALAAVSGVLFNGAPAPILYTGPGQVNAVVPFGLDLSANAELELMAGSQALGDVTVAVAPVSPALFTANSNGTGAGVILNQDYTVNSSANPARAGSVVILYGTGFGQVNPPAADGKPAPGAAPTVAPVTASIGSVPADVLYAGAAPGLIAGVVQINVRIPVGVTPGAAAQISLTVGGTTTAPGVTVAVQ